MQLQDITGFIYCPPDWDESKLRTQEASEAIRQISLNCFCDISFIEANNSIQITGDTREDVVKAQTELNILFFPPEQKSKKSWARPDRPGSWGQRRDLVSDKKTEVKKNDKKLKNKKSNISIKKVKEDKEISGEENEKTSKSDSESNKDQKEE